MKLNLKERKGITLIALIITIVILLILAGVALNIVLGDNGIFKKSKDSAQRYTESSLKEEISLLMGNWYMENTENGMALEDFLDAKRNDDTIEDYYKEDTDYVIVKDGYETRVDQKGNIIGGPDKINIPGKYRVRFETKGGTLAQTSKFIDQGNAIGDLPEPGKPTEESFFDGWYLDKNYQTQATSTTVPTTNITIYAKWGGPWRITYNLNGGTQQETEKYVARGSVIGILPTPTRAHHKFLGWYSKEDFEETSKVNENTEPTSDMELYAKWEAQCKITFNANGGECSETERYVDKNAQIGTLPTITKEHNEFKGWYTNSSYTTQATSSTVASSDMTVYAKWEAQCKITFNANGGTCSETERYVNKNTSIGTLPNPTKKDFVFGGWYKELSFTTEVSNSTIVTSDTIIYAKWIGKVYLYNKGNTYENITGGYEKITSLPSYDTSIIKEETNYIKINALNTRHCAGSIYTKNKINLMGYTKLIFDIDIYNSSEASCGSYGITDNINTSWNYSYSPKGNSWSNNSVTGNVKLEIDISSYNSSYYIQFQAYSNETHINSIYIE